MARKILTEHIDVPGIETFDVYRKQGGYTAVEKALKTMTPDEVVEEAKKSHKRKRRSGISNGYEMGFSGQTGGCAALSGLQC